MSRPWITRFSSRRLSAAAGCLPQRNSDLSTHMRCRMTARLRATATRARTMPRRFAICMPKARSEDQIKQLGLPVPAAVQRPNYTVEQYGSGASLVQSSRYEIVIRRPGSPCAGLLSSARVRGKAHRISTRRSIR